MLSRLSALLAALFIPALPVFAQTMADRVPADALVYVGWKGADPLGSAYDASHLKAVLEATDLSFLGSDAFSRSLAAAVRRHDTQLAAELPSLLANGRQLLKYPTAFYLAKAPDAPPVFALISEAGAQAQPLADRLRASSAGKGPLQISVANERLILSCGLDPHAMQLLTGNAAGDGALSAEPAFKAAMQQVNPDGALVAYINPPRILAAMPQSPGERAQQMRLITALGLDNLSAAALSGGFVGKDWGTRAFAAAPAPRQGVLKLLDGAPLAADMLQLAPRGATFVSCGSCDIASLLDETRASLQRFDPRLANSYDQFLAQARAIVGVDIRGELAASLGADWLVYGDPTIGGNSFLGWTLTNRPRDAAKLEATLARMEKTLAALANAKLRGNGMTFPLYHQQYGKTTVHCFALPLISPSWAVRDGVLFIGAYPQTVVAAADFVASGKPAFASNEAMAALKATAMPSSLTYCDLPRTAAGSYPTVVALSRYAGIADLMGVPTPLVSVPPLPTLLEHLSPALARSWNDAAGWHLESKSPFPCSELFSGQLEANPTMMQAPLMMSILLPSLSRARETANRAKCSNNLRQIALADIMYANENKQRYAPDLDTLLRTQGLSPQVLLCPSSSATALHDEKGHPCSYIYTGKGLTSDVPPDVVLAYEPLACHGGEGANFLYADGHVEWQQAASARAMIEMLQAGNNPPH